MAKKTSKSTKKTTKKTVSKVGTVKRKVKPQKPVAKRKKKVAEKEVAVVIVKQDNLFQTAVKMVKENPVEFGAAFLFGLVLSVVILF